MLGETAAIFHRLQNAIRRIIAAAQVNGIKAMDLRRVFDLNYALAWQLHSLASQPDLRLAARVVPKRKAMERFLLAAERLTTAELVQEARAAYDAFELTVVKHAEDRESFDAMVTLQGPRDAAGLRKIRRNAHRANAIAWGITSRCVTYTCIVHERPTGEIEGLLIYGHLGVQRLCTDTALFLPAPTRYANKPNEDTAPDDLAWEFIENACSSPLPQVKHTMGRDRSRHIFVQLEGLGKQSEAQVYWRLFKPTMPASMDSPMHPICMRCAVPAELMLIDLLVPRAWIRGDPIIESRMGTAEGYDIWARDLERQAGLPFENDGSFLGHSFSSLHSPAAPHYADLVQSEIARIGWSEDAFAIFRCEVQYPLLHSLVELRVKSAE